MLFTDSGRGMPADFAQYCALEPFTQQDPLDDGVGLGLPLVWDAVQALKGKMNLDTDTQTGTQVSIHLPLSELALRSGPTFQKCVQEPVTDNGNEHLGKTAWLFEPGVWKYLNNARYDHCRRALFASLSCTLRAWLDVDLDFWKSGDGLPTYLIVFHSDSTLR